ncbi:MAG: type I-E CRISPR-associated protein Cas6/Cse3/CasE [Deltaproteobacteria bacterium]|nr:type I-E CRISPR-associated protein Cas6/Cse3/CasE [Deltaproteobacteria bacterium]
MNQKRANTRFAPTELDAKQVDESDALKTLIQVGIGPAKAFGCGLMLVRRM